MNADAIDWKALERMRAAFLQNTAGAADYWQSESDLVSYDTTFAQRIGWKWDYVLGELKRRGWSSPKGELVDWGCGSGIASRAFLDHFGEKSVSALQLWDRSSLAMSYATARARAKYPRLNIVGGNGSPTTDSILLISHVLTELTPEQTQALADEALKAQCVLWVEPGTYESSLTLIAVRERLRGQFSIVAPCTHQERCGILARENERHWCHHFASPPSEVFTDSNWARFATATGIDLRDLPLSFLVLDKPPPPVLPANAGRVIGHARIYKGHALLLGCDASGVRERKLTKRYFPEEFKAWRKGKADVLCEWKCAGDELQEIKPLR
ncbi:MAG TPA: small ribosomal subunit Rsm22 family protein [Verrucomicrobiae bacterium]|nr:small ribosomal subunit Rsm22 family protein [Verrucomicrobiae bacterium]